MSKFILPLSGLTCAIWVTLCTSKFYSSSIYTYCIKQLSFTQITCLTELFGESINGWLRRRVGSKFCLIISLQPFLKFGSVKLQDIFCSVQKRRHFLDCSAPSGQILAAPCALHCLKVRVYYLSWLFHSKFPKMYRQLVLTLCIPLAILEFYSCVQTYERTEHPTGQQRSRNMEIHSAPNRNCHSGGKVQGRTLSITARYLWSFLIYIIQAQSDESYKRIVSSLPNNNESVP